MHTSFSETAIRQREQSRSRFAGGFAVLSAALLALLVLSSVASAITVRPEIANFGPDGTAGTSFASNSPLAFSQATKRLYTVDGGSSPGIFGFDASNPPAFPLLSGFSPLPVAPPNSERGLAVDNTALGSAGNVYYAPGIEGPAKGVYGFDSNGTPLGGNFPIDPGVTPGSGPNSERVCGMAVDSAGNLWVANYGLGRILKYNSAGVFQSSLDTLDPETYPPGARVPYPCFVAFDSNDNLYAGSNSFTIWKYTAASGYTAATEVEPQSAPQALAVDPATDHVFISHSSTQTAAANVAEYDSAGKLVTRFATEIPGFSAGIPGAKFVGLTVDASTDRVYVADEGNKKIRVYGPAFALPDVTIGAASGIANTSATLNGTISAQGEPLTDCHFEYVSEATFRLNGFSTATSKPCSPAFDSIPSDLTTHSVSAAASGLTANTSYRVRLFAANAKSSIATTDASFTTSGPVIVETTGSPIRTTTTARLDSRVDPSGAAATYYFEYGDQGPCDANPCTATDPHAAGSSTVTQLVSEQIGGLQPNTTYHYRVVADNGNVDGGAFGDDMTVTTRASDAALTHGRLPGPPGSDRAYEQISTPNTGGNPTQGGLAFSDDGDRVMYRIAGGTPISGTGTILSQFFAERTSSGWKTTSIDPPRDELIGPNWPAARAERSLLVPDPQLQPDQRGVRDVAPVPRCTRGQIGRSSPESRRQLLRRCG